MYFTRPHRYLCYINIEILYEIGIHKRITFWRIRYAKIPIFLDLIDCLLYACIGQCHCRYEYDMILSKQAMQRKY